MTEVQFFTMYWSVFVFIVGACVGSFLNVVIYRLPAGLSVVRPGSRCACGHPIPVYCNIPVLSWFLLRGRSRCCGQKFSFRYPAVELFTAVLFLLLWLQYGLPVSLGWMLFAGLMIPAALIDWDTMEIPDVFSVGGFILGLFCSMLLPEMHHMELSGLWILDGMRGGIAALLGACVGSGLVLWIALTAEALLRKEAMGFGDVKLMGAIGAFCGWQGAVFSIFGGAVLGIFIVLLTLPFGARKEGAKETVGKDTQEGVQDGEQEGGEDSAGRIPFGPALAGAALLYVLFFEPMVTDYFSDVVQLLQTF